MHRTLRSRLVALAQRRITGDDPSHDLHHALRVLANAERIARAEGADLDVIVPAALLHDVVNHPKHDPRASRASDESAALAARILRRVPGYPRAKISAVAEAIARCSFSKGLPPATLEAAVLQDADGLEATGAIAIMRTFASTGQMRRPFYHASDPFCRTRVPDPKHFAVDLFYARLLKVLGRMHTPTARRIAKRRTAFLQKFLAEFRRELAGH